MHQSETLCGAFYPEEVSSPHAVYYLPHAERVRMREKRLPGSENQHRFNLYTLKKGQVRPF